MSNFPKTEKEHAKISGRVRLLQLESEGGWVFHGSGATTDILEPRQAYHYPNNSEEGKIPEGKPAVYASLFADVAIFMAMFNSANAPRGARSGFDVREDGSFEFRVTKETMSQIHKARGYVHVFGASVCIQKSLAESLSYKPVRPKEVVVVTEKDLPNSIKIEDF